jgi:hypothetical protein
MKLHKEPPPGYFDRIRASSVSERSSPRDSTFSHSRTASGASSQTNPSSTSSVSNTANHLSSLDADEWLTRSHDDVDLNEPLPTQQDLSSVGDIQLYDANGNTRTFRSLYSGDDVMSERQLIIFVRHFYCGVRTFSTV